MHTEPRRRAWSPVRHEWLQGHRSSRGARRPRGHLQGCHGLGHPHRPLHGMGFSWCGNRRPQKSIQVARLLRPVPGSSEYHFPTFCRSSLDSGQEGLLSEGLAAPPWHPEREGPGFPAAVAPLLSWGCPPSHMAVEHGSPEAAQPPPAPHFTRRGLGALSWAVLMYHPAKWRAGGEEPGQGV